MKNSTLDLEQVAQFSSKTVWYNAQGVIGTAEPGVVTNMDLLIADDHFISGGHLRVKGAQFGDFCHVQIVDKDQVYKTTQVPGQPTGVVYGMLPGYPLLRQFVTNWYLTDTETKQADINLPYASKVLAGMYVRLVYNSIAAPGTEPAQAAFNYNLHRALF